MFSVNIIKSKRKLEECICLFCAFVSSVAISFVLSDGTLRISNSVISLVLFAGCYIVIKYAVFECKNVSWKFGGVAGSLFSILWVLGDNMFSYDYSMILSWVTWVKILFIAPFFCSLCRIIEDKLCGIINKRKEISEISLSKKTFLLYWFLIILCWLPIWLAAFPGIYAYDATAQTAEFYANIGLSGHHPIAHTSVLWGLIMLGEKVFGTYESGMALYSIVQMVVMSAIFGYVIYKLKQWGISRVVYIVCLLMYMLLPIHGILAISATKDVFFTGFFTLVVVFLFDFGKDMKRFMSSPLKLISFGLSVFAMAIFRNNGMYAFVFCIPFLIWIGKKYWKQILAVCAGCFLAYICYMGPISSALGVTSGDFREALSIPIQQLSRAMSYNSDELTEEEKQKIEELIPDYMNYTPRISDSTKGTFQTEMMKEDVPGFLKLWIQVGIKCPVTYIDAFLSNSIGFWYPDMQYPDPGAFHAYIEYENTPYDFHTGGEYDISPSYLLIEKQSKLPVLDKILHYWAYKLIHQKIPAISMLFNIGMYAWVLMGTVLLCIIQKKWKFMPVCMLLTGLWLTCLLSPVVWLRYGYPLITGIPVLLAVCLQPFHNRNLGKESR